MDDHRHLYVVDWRLGNGYLEGHLTSYPKDPLIVQVTTGSVGLILE